MSSGQEKHDGDKEDAHEEEQGDDEELDEEHGDDHGDDGHGGHDEHDDHGHDDNAKHEEHAHEEKPEEPKPSTGKKKGITESEALILLALAILGRVLLKVTPLTNIPSVEPIIPIAVFAGLAYGTQAGILVGLLAYPLSNFLLPGEFFGLWIIWQAVGGAVAGGLAGLANKATFNNMLWFTALGTILFELAANIPNQDIWSWGFSDVHVISNFIFAALIGLFVLKEK